MPLRLYALLGAVIAFMGLGLVAYHYKIEVRDAVVQRDAAVRDRDAAVEVNRQNDMVVAAEHADKERSDKLAADLADELDRANQSALDMATTLSELRSKDATVDDYLKLPVPDALRRLYDHSQTASGH